MTATGEEIIMILTVSDTLRSLLKTERWRSWAASEIIATVRQCSGQPQVTTGEIGEILKATEAAGKREREMCRVMLQRALETNEAASVASK